MSNLLKDFNKGSLYDELKLAIKDDKMYWVRNDAKIRACVTSKTYEEFCDTVAAAHLKPLDKKDKGKKIRGWNNYASPEKLE